MIQDIAPHRYDNTYHIQKPGAQDYVFCIQKGRILLRETAEEHVLTIPRREEIEAAVPELMDRAVYLFSVDEKPYFLVSVPEKEAEEILAKLKEGAGQMPVSDKNNMEAGKTDSGKLEGAEKELEQLYYAWKTPTDIRAMEPMHQAFAAITAVQLWRWRQSRQFCGRCGAKTEDSKIERALVCPVCGQTMIGFFAELDGDDKIRLQEDELSEAGWYTREEIPDDARLISVGTEMKMYFKYGPDWEKKWQEHQK